MTKIYWDIKRWDTEFALDNLKEYFGLIEDQFGFVKEKEKQKIPHDPPSGLDEEDYSLWRSEVDYFEFQYDLLFPSKIRYSFLVLLFIEFENQIRVICDEIAKRRNIEKRFKDLQGSLFDKVKEFLEKIALIPVIEMNQDLWQWINDLQKVRDCIVHTNGQINLSRDEVRIRDLCKRQIGLAIEGSTLLIEKSYCLESLNKLRKFFDHLFQKADFGPSIPVVEK